MSGLLQLGTTVPTDVHHNRLLSNLLIAYRPEGFIGPDVFPIVRVGKQTDEYAIIDKDDWLRIPTTNRAPGESPKEVSFSVSSDTYNCGNRALGTTVWHETQDNADEPFQPLADGATFLRDQLSLDFENRVYTTLSTGVGSNQTLTGGNALNQFATSDPITNFRTARQAVRATTGLRPNVAIVPQLAMDVLMYHPDLIKAAYPGAGVGGTVSAQQLAMIMQVDRVLVPDTIKNTAQEGQANVFTDVWSTGIFFLHVKPNPGLRSATFGVAFQWVGGKIARNAQPGNWQVMQREDDKRGVTELWSGYFQDEKVIAPELGFRIDTGIS